MKPFRHRLNTWIACFAILFASLAPAASHALATDASHAFWAEICSANDQALSPENGAPSPDAPVSTDKGMHVEHCPFCLTHADALALPPATAIAVPVLDNRRQHPSLFYHAPRPLFAWSAAQPRGPPAVA